MSFNYKSNGRVSAFSNEEKRYLLDNAGKYSLDEFSEIMGIPSSKIKNQLQRQCLTVLKKPAS